MIFGVLLALGAAYAVFTTITGIGIPCVFHSVTGLKCPGCGVSRMIISLVHLDFAAAFHYNAALFVLIPVFLILAFSLICRYIRLGTQKLSRGQSITVIVMIVLLVLFGIVRNLPGFEYL